MSNIEFSAQYKHPEWQKKRLEALNAAEFICQRCYIDDEQLHVHHKRYVKGRKIWEYDITELEVLCDECHAEAHKDKDLLNLIVSRLPSEGINEINSLLIVYISLVEGPSGAADLKDILDVTENPWATMIGHIAGMLSNRADINTLLYLSKKLDETPDGEDIIFSFSKKKSRGF